MIEDTKMIYLVYALAIIGLWGVIDVAFCKGQIGVWASEIIRNWFK